MLRIHAILTEEILCITSELQDNFGRPRQMVSKQLHELIVSNVLENAQ
jgi:hypothetical protein